MIHLCLGEKLGETSHCTPSNMPYMNRWKKCQQTCHHLAGLSTLFCLDQTCQHHTGHWSVTWPVWCWQVTGRFSDKQCIFIPTCWCTTGHWSIFGYGPFKKYFLNQTCRHHTGHWSVTRPAWCWQVTGRFSDKRCIFLTTCWCLTGFWSVIFISETCDTSAGHWSLFRCMTLFSLNLLTFNR